MAASRSRSKKVAKRECSAIGRWVSTQPHSSVPRLIWWRGANTSLSFFCLIPRPVSRMQCGVLTNLDWVRLALPRPPNLDSQYQRM